MNILFLSVNHSLFCILLILILLLLLLVFLISLLLFKEFVLSSESLFLSLSYGEEGDGEGNTFSGVYFPTGF